jgi:hypothetical protein
LGFEDAIRDVAIRAVQTTFTRIGVDRLASYLNLTGKSIDIGPGMNYSPSREGSDLEVFVSKLGWSLRSGVVEIPPNPDNQIESTIVQENIKLPRMSSGEPGAFAANMARFRTRQNHFPLSTECLMDKIHHLVFGAGCSTLRRGDPVCNEVMSPRRLRRFPKSP